MKSGITLLCILLGCACASRAQSIKADGVIGVRGSVYAEGGSLEQVVRGSALFRYTSPSFSIRIQPEVEVSPFARGYLTGLTEPRHRLVLNVREATATAEYGTLEFTGGKMLHRTSFVDGPVQPLRLHAIDLVRPLEWREVSEIGALLRIGNTWGLEGGYILPSVSKTPEPGRWLPISTSVDLTHTDRMPMWWTRLFAETKAVDLGMQVSYGSEQLPHLSQSLHGLVWSYRDQLKVGLQSRVRVGNHTFFAEGVMSDEGAYVSAVTGWQWLRVAFDGGNTFLEVHYAVAVSQNGLYECEVTDFVCNQSNTVFSRFEQSFGLFDLWRTVLESALHLEGGVYVQPAVVYRTSRLEAMLGLRIVSAWEETSLWYMYRHNDHVFIQLTLFM